ncbi:shikimate kinase [Candidatus Peregrinibacteria bacterium]|nr:shikimate kinase [Candidatus Peregrinibacteria bacterium]
MNIVLTGLRGSGKTKIGKLLSEKLGWKLINSDTLIEKHENSPIRTIVETKGWKYFREIENKIIKDLKNTDQTIISLGGGAILNIENEKIIKKNSKIIYLHEKPETCAKRILKDKNRPPLTKKTSIEEEIKQLYKERNSHYSKSANIIFHRTDNLEKDVDEIIKDLGIP